MDAGFRQRSVIKYFKAIENASLSRRGVSERSDFTVRDLQIQSCRLRQQNLTMKHSLQRISKRVQKGFDLFCRVWRPNDGLFLVQFDLVVVFASR